MTTRENEYKHTRNDNKTSNVVRSRDVVSPEKGGGDNGEGRDENDQMDAGDV